MDPASPRSTRRLAPSLLLLLAAGSLPAASILGVPVPERHLEATRAARRRLAATPSGGAAVLDAEPARRLAALSLSRQPGHEISVELLGQALGRERDPALAAMMVRALGVECTPPVVAILVEHLRGRGRASGEAVELLSRCQSREAHEVLLEVATDASPRREASMQALRAIALIEDDRARQILVGHHQGLSEELRRAAGQALELRAQAGLPHEPGYREVPYGPPIEALLQDLPPPLPPGTRVDDTGRYIDVATGEEVEPPE